MAQAFYHFVSSDKKSTIYLNKEQIVSINQVGIGFGTDIKMINGDVFKVEHTAEQVLSILEKKKE